MSLETEIARLLAGEHHDPHSVLGAHPERSGIAVRALRPGAAAMHVVPKRGAPVEMARIDPVGLFAAYLPRRKLPLDYRLQVIWPDGIEWTYDDPYSRPPRLGELDLHLISEGRHERLWEVLGAQVRDDGTRSPSGRRRRAGSASSATSTLGRARAPDAVARLVGRLGARCPGLGAGERYKFEVRPRSRAPDPQGRPARRRRGACRRPRPRSSIAPAIAGPTTRGCAGRGAAVGRPMSIYEVHLGSWRRNPLEGNRPLNYAELADELADYAPTSASRMSS